MDDPKHVTNPAVARIDVHPKTTPSTAKLLHTAMSHSSVGFVFKALRKTPFCRRSKNRPHQRNTLRVFDQLRYTHAAGIVHHCFLNLVLGDLSVGAQGSRSASPVVNSVFLHHPTSAAVLAVQWYSGGCTTTAPDPDRCHQPSCLPGDQTLLHPT